MKSKNMTITAEAYKSRSLEFQKNGYLQIGNFISHEQAVEMRETLHELSCWATYCAGTDRKPINISNLAALPQEYMNMAIEGFQYNFRSVRLFQRDRDRTNKNLERLQRFFEGDQFRASVGKLTGLGPFKEIDGHAAKYNPGDFLNAHTDEISSETSNQRKIAFIYYLSDWRPDWGGLTHLWSIDRTSALTLVPSFNQLLILRVPRWHSVGTVAPFAPHSRISIAGWLL